jgi:hypothetical protein
MMRGQRALRDSQAPSPEGSEEEDEARSPVTDGEGFSLQLKTPPMGSVRGRKSKNTDSEEGKRDALDVLH